MSSAGEMAECWWLVALLASVGGEDTRVPRLFWTTTSSFTSVTATTTTICFVSTTTALVACRRRRSLAIWQQPIQPSPVVETEVEPSRLEGEEEEEKEEQGPVPRYLKLFTASWSGTTTVSTTYTATSTVASVVCTPSGFLFSLC